VSTPRRPLCLYLNTSTLIRALEDPGARRFLADCCSRHRCVVSNVHRLEGWREETMRVIGRLLERLGVEEWEVDLDQLDSAVDRLLRERGWSTKRTIDLMHVLAAVELSCQGIVAVDRFIGRRAKEYGLLYVNHYTGCP